MTHAPQRKYRHRDLILGLSGIALLLFIILQIAYYVLASPPRWLFVSSFSAPNLVAFLIAPRITMRRGLQTGIVLAGIIGVSLVGMGLIGLLFLCLRLLHHMALASLFATFGRVVYRRHSLRPQS